MEFFNNKDNDILKFKINSEGVDVNSIEARLILMTKENKNMLLIGKIENDTCKFDIPQLENYNKGDNGKIKFEIISEEMYFPVWEDKFEINSKASIKIEEMVNEIQQKSARPTISLESTSLDAKPVFEKKNSNKEEKVEEKSNIKNNKTLSKLESIFETKQDVVIEDEEEKIEENKKEEIKKDKKTVDPIMKFDNFDK